MPIPLVTHRAYVRAIRSRWFYAVSLTRRTYVGKFVTGISKDGDGVSALILSARQDRGSQALTIMVSIAIPGPFIGSVPPQHHGVSSATEGPRPTRSSGRASFGLESDELYSF